MKSDDYGHVAEQRTEAAEVLRSTLGELESGNALSDFVEGHGLQSWYFVFSWRSDWLSIEYRLPSRRSTAQRSKGSFSETRMAGAKQM